MHGNLPADRGKARASGKAPGDGRENLHFRRLREALPIAPLILTFHLCDHSHDYGHGGCMSRMIKASEFKAKCLAIMDEVERTGEAVVITKNGKPVAELVPHRASRPKLLGLLKDRLFI